MDVTPDGRVTIPEHVRVHLGLSEGGDVDFEILPGGDVVLRRVAARAARDEALSRYRGMFRSGPSTDEIMRLTRGG